jgi:hypothetical protein
VFEATAITESVTATAINATADDIVVLVQVLPEFDEIYTEVLVVATRTVPVLDTATYEKSPLIDDDDEDQLTP